MPYRLLLPLFAVAFAPITTSAADKPNDHNAAVEAALKPAEKWPGVIKSYIGVTRLGTRIPCLVTKEDGDYGTKKRRILLVGGLDGSKKSVEVIMALMDWFYTARETKSYRARYVLSAVPIANPDGWAAGKGPGNLSGGNPTKGYPPKGPFYSTKSDPEAAYLWRWIPLHAPDIVLFLPRKVGAAYRMSDASKKSLGIGTIPVDPYSTNSKGINLERAQLILYILRIKEHNRKQLYSPARKELQRRIARSPIQIAKQLSKKYGHNLNSVAYIPALALVGRVRLGELTGDTSHLQDVERIVAPYFTGRKKTFGKRASGSNLSGHLIFAELARVSKDPAKRKRYTELVLKAADQGFDKDGKPKKAMPAHLEMSDSVFMGGPILVAAGKLTGEQKYYDMALRHLRFMLKLNLRKDGLHRHSPLHETAWGRGNGFPALGLALCLTDLPKSHPGYKEMLAAFRNHMAAMAKHQDYTGAWHQVVDHPESYRELTVTCMTTFAMIRGIRNGWLDKKTYEPIVRKAWTAIKTRIAPDATLVDVCTGTGKQRSLRAYYDRKAILGHDPRGGAMALMVTTEMAAWEKEKSGKTSGKAKTADKQASARKTFKRFLRAFADADTKAMKEFYAPSVTVGRGSTLLNPKYGKLADGKDEDEDHIVKREQLLRAYEKAIVALGGKKNWKERGVRLLKDEVRFELITKEWIRKIKAAKLKVDVKVGDVLVIVIPKGDSLTFFLQKNKKGKWIIVGEHWD